MRPTPLRRAGAIVPALALIGCLATGGGRSFDLVYAAEDTAEADRIESLVLGGIRDVEAFFGQPFAARFKVEVFPDRQAFDASFPPAWGLSKTEQWMVASGVATDLRVLSPRVWSTQASGHDARDDVHIQGIVTHELVHVYHGQRNANADFEGMDAMGWFLEGVAVYASGQLDEGHVASAREAVARGRLPASLDRAWSGKYRYGVSGSLVQYLDTTVGRSALTKMLAATTSQELLDIAGMSEDELLSRWEESLRHAR